MPSLMRTSVPVFNRDLDAGLIPAQGAGESASAYKTRVANMYHLPVDEITDMLPVTNN